MALQYRWGGGIAGEVGVGVVSKLDSPPAQVQDVVNVVSALGGKNAETLDQAKARAPKDLKVLGRAVTSEDFQIFTMQTPGLRVARAEVVPLRTPFADLITDGPGLDTTRERAGALSVIVVPDTQGPFPTPTDGMLRKVCAWLDKYRLVTTEVHVVPPMYVRIYDICVTVKPKPGFSKAVLREAIAARLEHYFHVLTGGEEQHGFPFGGAVHHADLVAQVFRVDGVDTVTCVEAYFDGRKLPVDGQDSASTDLTWRNERSTARHLTGCIVDAAVDVTVLQLALDENLFIDSSTLTVVIEA